MFLKTVSHSCILYDFIKVYFEIKQNTYMFVTAMSQEMDIDVDDCKFRNIIDIILDVIQFYRYICS